MKNLIYILIFLPSLLFSQETKNMEFVGVRNITINAQENSEITFEVDQGIILKVLSFTHNSAPSSDSYSVPWLKLNNEYLYYGKIHYNYGTDNSVEANVPFYLSEGTHELKINSYNNNTFTATLYALEFKLTTQ